LFFTISWTAPGDVDTYVTTPLGHTIYWQQRDFDGGTLDVDDRVGTGPENVFWATAPPSGTYYFCADTYDSSNVGLTVYYQTNSATIKTKILADTTDKNVYFPDTMGCNEAYPNYLDKWVQP
jgi:uncharacterized protein YfaP (DUF2135 family)